MTHHSEPAREAVAPGSVWTHHSGREYRVLFVANDTPDPKPDYPPTVVYEGVQNGKRWAGRLDDWHPRMTLSASPPSRAAESDGRPDGWSEALAISFIAANGHNPEMGMFAKSFNEGAWQEIEDEWPEFVAFAGTRIRASLATDAEG